MQTNQREIVVGVDGSVANKAAIAYAVALGARLDAPVTFVAAVIGDTISSQPGESGWAVLAETTEDARREHPDQHFGSRILFGEAASCILEAAKEAEIVVLGKRGLGTFGRLLLGSVSTAVAEGASCPVIVVPQEWRASAEHAADAPVIVGTSAGGHDHALLIWAFSEAQRTGSRLDVVHAIDLEPMLMWDPLLGSAAYREWDEGSAERMADVISPLQAQFPDVEVHRITERGNAANILLDRSADARLIVVGRHHRTRFGLDFGLGSTERGVLHHAEIPVAVIPIDS
jgi:nucleotide-binding universal stress UspA family protein